MKKIIVVLIIGLIGIAVLIGSKTPQSASNRTELSSRAKEYIESQKSQGNIEYAGVADNQNAKGSKSGKVNNPGCYSLEIPFQIADKKKLGECFDQISINSPKGIINVYIKKVSYETLDSDPGVKMRRADPKTYKEESRTYNGYAYVIFKKSDAGYEKTALYLKGGKLFSLNLLVSSSDPELDKKFNNMLSSVDLL